MNFYLGMERKCKVKNIKGQKQHELKPCTFIQYSRRQFSSLNRISKQNSQKLWPGGARKFEEHNYLCIASFFQSKKLTPLPNILQITRRNLPLLRNYHFSNIEVYNRSTLQHSKKRLVKSYLKIKNKISIQIPALMNDTNDLK